MPKITMDGKVFSGESLRESGEQVLTIKHVPDKKENVAKEDDEPDMKWVVYFHETDTKAALNKTRLSQLIDIFGSNNSDDWLDKKVVVYCDPNVTNKGKKVGGVAFKAYEAESKLFPKGMKV